ncbi:MAG: hypothetical protein AAF639_36635 [Chloroflexota bacterium]
MSEQPLREGCCGGSGVVITTKSPFAPQLENPICIVHVRPAVRLLKIGPVTRLRYEVNQNEPFLADWRDAQKWLLKQRGGAVFFQRSEDCVREGETETEEEAEEGTEIDVQAAQSILPASVPDITVIDETLPDMQSTATPMPLGAIAPEPVVEPPSALDEIEPKSVTKTDAESESTKPESVDEANAESESPKPEPVTEMEAEPVADAPTEPVEEKPEPSKPTKSTSTRRTTSSRGTSTKKAGAK